MWNNLKYAGRESTIFFPKRYYLLHSHVLRHVFPIILFTLKNSCRKHGKAPQKVTTLSYVLISQNQVMGWLKPKTLKAILVYFSFLEKPSSAFKMLL